MAIGKTVTEYIENSLDEQYGQADTLQLAQAIIKENINIETAIVSVLASTGIAGFKFNIPEREQIKFQTDITDHYTDRNNPIQDNISQKPITVTLTGSQGEYFYSVNQIEDTISKVVPTLSLVKQFMPKLTSAAKQVFSKKLKVSAKNSKKTQEIRGINKYLINSIDIFLLFQQICKISSSQTRAYLFLKALWKSKAIFSVETTYERFDNMAIIDLIPNRDGNADITDFSVTFKQLNFTETITRDLNNAIGRTREQLAEIAKKGLDKGKKVANL